MDVLPISVTMELVITLVTMRPLTVPETMNLVITFRVLMMLANVTTSSEKVSDYPGDDEHW